MSQLARRPEHPRPIGECQIGVAEHRRKRRVAPRVHDPLRVDADHQARAPVLDRTCHPVHRLRLRQGIDRYPEEREARHAARACR